MQQPSDLMEQSTEESFKAKLRLDEPSYEDVWSHKADADPIDPNLEVSDTSTLIGNTSLESAFSDNTLEIPDEDKPITHKFSTFLPSSFTHDHPGQYSFSPAASGMIYSDNHEERHFDLYPSKYYIYNTDNPTRLPAHNDDEVIATESMGGNVLSNAFLKAEDETHEEELKETEQSSNLDSEQKLKRQKVTPLSVRYCENRAYSNINFPTAPDHDDRFKKSDWKTRFGIPDSLPAPERAQMVKVIKSKVRVFIWETFGINLDRSWPTLEATGEAGPIVDALLQRFGQYNWSKYLIQDLLKNICQQTTQNLNRTRNKQAKRAAEKASKAPAADDAA